MRLTRSTVKRLEVRDKEYVVWCERLPGFGCRVWPSGRKSYIVQYRIGGRRSPTRKKTIGESKTLTTEQARKAAEIHLASAKLGDDLVETERRSRAALTVSELCDEYLKHGVGLKKPSTIKTDIGRIDGHIKPLLGTKKISSLTRRDMERFLQDVASGKTARDVQTRKQGRSIVKGGKGAATRTVRLLGGILSYAVNQGYIDSNPRTGVKLFKDGRNERYLSEPEIDRLFAALKLAETDGLPWTLKRGAKAEHRPSEEHQREIISPHVTAAIRLLLLTGCRLREILHLRWNEIDWDKRWIVLPDSKTGHRIVPLSDQAVNILEHLPRIGTFVVCGKFADKPRSDLKKPWLRISKHAELEGVRLHDLRHTFASLAAKNGLSLQIIGAQLGHKSQETTARYAHLCDRTLRDAANMVGKSIPD